MESLIWMTLMSTVVSTLAQVLAKELQNFIANVKYWYEKYILREKFVVIKNSFTQSKEGFWRAGDANINDLIKALLCYMKKKSVYFNQTEISSAYYGRITDKKESDMLILVPQGLVIIDGIFKVSITKTFKDGSKENGAEKTYTITIYGPSVQSIDEWLSKIHYDYLKELYFDLLPGYYLQTISDKPQSTFNRFNINNKTTFDDIYGPHKEVILSSLDKFQKGELNKLTLLLHGSPGTGKTSIIKAIAQITKRNIIHIKLPYISNDNELMNIFFNNFLSTENNGTVDVELNKRIYVFEDIDADGNITHKREIEPVKEEIPKHKMSKDVLEFLKTEKTKGVTLAGILNVLDGPLELNGCIVIMTTNHREKLDPALIRSGRIMLDLKLENLEHKYAQQIVDKYYPGKVLSPLKQNVNPAELVDMCRQSTNFENLFDLLTEKDYL